MSHVDAGDERNPKAEEAVLQFVQAGRAAMPAAVDARLLARLDAGHGGRVGGSAWLASGRLRRLLAAAIVLAGVSVTAAVLWQQRTAPQPAAEPPGQEPQPPREMEVRGLAVVSDAATTVGKSPLLLVVEVTFPSGMPAKDGFRGKVLRVLKGDRALAGQTVWLAWNPAGATGERGFLDVDDLAQPGQGAVGAAWLMTLEPQGRHGEWPQLHDPFAARLGATRVSKGVALAADPATLLDLVRAQLLAALDDAEAGVRASAMAALCQWDGTKGGAPGADSPWRDPTAAAKLLAHADDREPAVRVQLAGNVPLLSGDAGHAALERLVFDRYSAVRWSALVSLQRFPVPEWWQDLKSAPGTWWDDLTMPRGLWEWSWRAEAKAQAEGITTRVGAFERQLKKDNDFNHLLGALGLGSTADPAALPLLQGLAKHHDAHVRAAAAGSRARLGDRTGYDALRTLVTGENLIGAICALDMLRGLETRESLDVVEQATRDPRRLVRALAAAGLRDLRPVASHLVDARLGDLQKDPEEMVRIAAGAH